MMSDMEGEQVQVMQTETVPDMDKWYTPLTHPTRLSRYLAMTLFVALPFVGFWLGTRYADEVSMQSIANYSQGVVVRTSDIKTGVHSMSSPGSNISEISDVQQSIRSIDFETLLNTQFDYHTDCAVAPGVDTIKDFATIYADITGDGNEEAVITAWSCLSGTGGADVHVVYSLDNQGNPIRLPVEESLVFEGKDYSVGIAGHVKYGVEYGSLVMRMPVYRDGDANCCPSGGDRAFTFEWDGKSFVVSKVADTHTSG